jgi:acyl-coenzyme A synthetase/AMP-(fatty) acid ligase
MTEIYGSTETSGVGVRKWPAERYRLMPHWSSTLRVDNGDALQLTSSLGRKVSLMDAVEVDDADTFIVVGRRDSAVQVGGTNAFPSRVAALLGARPGVQSAAVRLMRATEGNRLKAFVVPEAGEDEGGLLFALQSWISLNLPVAERPMAIQFGAALPLTRLGKDADW